MFKRFTTRRVKYHHLQISLVSNMSYSTAKSLGMKIQNRQNIQNTQNQSKSRINQMPENTENTENTEIIKIFNSMHLGDNIFNILSLNKAIGYIESKNRFIHYYLKEDYIKQVHEFVKSPRIILKPDKHLQGNAFNMWIGDRRFSFNYFNSRLIDEYKPYNKFYVRYHNECFKSLNIPVEIDTIAYDDQSLLERYNALHPMYKNIDVLLVNSIPQSGQFIYNYNHWLSLCKILLQNKINIVTTEKITNVKCTRDRGLSVRDIAALSTNVKVIIAINSGVCPGLFNNYTLNRVSRFYIFDIYNFYSFKNFTRLVNIKHLPIHEIIRIVKHPIPQLDIAEDDVPEIEDTI